MNYSEAASFLNENFVSFQTAGRSAYRGGLETITAMCRAMGDPQRDYLTIHIAGTNGKGSVAHILASVLQAAGYRTGLYTSPHLHDFRERIRVDGEPIPQKGVAGFFTDYGEKMKEAGLSYFEMTTAMAFKWFSKSGVEVAVIETGLGGRLDATNVITPVLGIITNIGPEHRDILGDTPEKIAAEKAGIIKKGVPVLIGRTDPGSSEVFTARAAESDAPLIFAGNTYECTGKALNPSCQRFTIRRLCDGRTQEIDLDLLGAYQQENLITARAAISLLRHKTQLNISTRAMLAGCRNVVRTTGLSGRWQVISNAPLTVADGGHNPHAIMQIARQLESQDYDKLYMVVGFAADKEMNEILPLLPEKAHYIFTQADSPRALPAEKLAIMAASHGLKGITVKDAAPALEKARTMASNRDMIFIGGSFYLVSEII